MKSFLLIICVVLLLGAITLSVLFLRKVSIEKNYLSKVRNGVSEQTDKLKAESKARCTKYNFLNKICIALSVVMLAITLIVPGSIYQVETGQIAVVKQFGKIVDTKTPGIYFDFWVGKEYAYFDTTIQKLDIDTASYSSDAQTMDIQLTVQYKIDQTNVENILKEYINMESLASRIEKVADDSVKAVLSQYTAMQIIETRATISPEVEKAIKEAVGTKYYSDITAVNLTNIDFTDEFEKAVEDKVVAEQQKQAAITKAEQELEVAKLQAQAKIEAARGDAEAQKIIAEAEGRAIALKVVELAKTFGFDVKETYTVSTQTVVTDTNGNVLSNNTVEITTTVKPTENSTVVSDSEVGTITTTTITIVSTDYYIQYDESHTHEDLDAVVDLLKYLEYLEKWDGKLPDVVAGENGLDILIPNN